MKRGEIARTLQARRQDLKDTYGVSSLALFGSVARDEATAESDVDFVVEFDRPIGLFHFFQFQHWLEETLGVSRVDLVMRDAIRPVFRERIQRETIDVF